MSQPTAEVVFKIFGQLPSDERAKFYALLGEQALSKNHQANFTHEEIFGHLTEAEFTAAEAADYLDVSMSTFRRYVKTGRIAATSQMGRNQLFSSQSLKAFKRSLRGSKAAGD